MDYSSNDKHFTISKYFELLFQCDYLFLNCTEVLKLDKRYFLQCSAAIYEESDSEVIFGLAKSIFKYKNPEVVFTGMSPGPERITAEIEAAETAGEEATLRTGTAAEMIGDKKVLRLHPMPFAGTTEEDIRYQLVYVDDENILRPYLNTTFTETGEQIPTFVTFSLDQMQRDLIQFYSEQ